MKRIALLLGGLAGCAGVFGIPSDVDRASVIDGGTDGGGAIADVFVAPIDAGPDGTTPPPPPGDSCDPTSDFEDPVLLDNISSPGEAEGSPRLSDDELTIYFDATRAELGGQGLYFATRKDRNDPFAADLVQRLLTTGSPGDTFAPNVINGGLTLIFEVSKSENSGSTILQSTRGTPNDLFPIGFSTAVSGDVMNPFVRPTAPSSIFYVTDSDDHTNLDLRANLSKDDGPITTDRLDALNSTSQERFPVVSADLLTVYFASSRPVNGIESKDLQIYVAQRPSTNQPFGEPQRLRGNVNEEGADSMPGWISTDQCRLYMFRGHPVLGPSVQDIFVATRNL